MSHTPKLRAKVVIVLSTSLMAVFLFVQLRLVSVPSFDERVSIYGKESRTVLDEYAAKFAVKDVLFDQGPLRIAIVSSYPKRKCGVATFAHHLHRALKSVLSAESAIDIIAVIRDKSSPLLPGVVFTINEGVSADYFHAAHWIDAHNYNYVLVMHEFGIFGGVLGSYILTFLQELHTPYAVTVHTVPLHPSAVPWFIVNRIAAHALFIANINPTGCSKMTKLYKIPPSKCVFIPHGIADSPFERNESPTSKKVILSFGLLSPSKGLEELVDSMTKILEKVPSAMLVIAGEQHPDRVDDYVKSIRQRVIDCGISRSVKFIPKFLKEEELQNLLRSSHVFVTYYPDMSQASSGTLSLAMGMGVACVATPFEYAKSMFEDGSGILVTHGDQDQLIAALVRVLMDDGLRSQLSISAYKRTRAFVWSSVARRYIKRLSYHHHDTRTHSLTPNHAAIEKHVAQYRLCKYHQVDGCIWSSDKAAALIVARANMKKLSNNVMDYMSLLWGTGMKHTQEIYDNYLRGLSHGLTQGHAVFPVSWTDAVLGMWNGVRTVSVDEGHVKLVHGRDFTSGVTIGGQFLSFSYDGNTYDVRLLEDVHDAKLSRVKGHNGEDCGQVSVFQIIKAGKAAVGRVTVDILMCQQPFVDIRYKVEAGDYMLKHVALSTGFDWLSGYCKGVNYDAFSVYSGDELIHETICDVTSDFQTLYQSESPDASSWRVVYGKKHSHAFFSTTLTGANNYMSTTNKLAKMHGGKFHWLQNHYNLDLSDGSSLIEERTMLLGRAWPSRFPFYAKFMHGVHSGDPSEPRNVGLVARSLASLLNNSTKNAMPIVILALDALRSLTELHPMSTNVHELADAIDAASKLVVPFPGLSIDPSDEIIYIIEKLASKVLDYAQGKTFSCYSGQGVDIDCHAAAILVLGRSSLISNAPVRIVSHLLQVAFNGLHVVDGVPCVHTGIASEPVLCVHRAVDSALILKSCRIYDQLISAQLLSPVKSMNRVRDAARKQLSVCLLIEKKGVMCYASSPKRSKCDVMSVFRAIDADLD